MDAQTADASTNSFTASDCEAAASNTLVRDGYAYYLDKSLNAAQEGEAGYGYAKGNLTVEGTGRAVVAADGPVSLGGMLTVQGRDADKETVISEAVIGDGKMTACLDNAQVSLLAEAQSDALELNASLVEIQQGASLSITDLKMDASSSLANRAAAGAVSIIESAAVTLGGSIEGDNTLVSWQLDGVTLEAGASLVLSFDPDFLYQLQLPEEGEIEDVTVKLANFSYEGDSPAITLDFGALDAACRQVGETLISMEDGSAIIVFSVEAVPEPATAALSLLALAAFALRRRRPACSGN